MLRYFSILALLVLLPENACSQEDSSTTAIPFACGRTGYFQCPGELACCPVGFTCEQMACVTKRAPAANSVTECAGRHGYHLCPQSLGGDCCPNGYICATETDAPCRLTLRLAMSTETVTSTVTDTSGAILGIGIATRITGPSLTAAVDRVVELISQTATSSDSGPQETGFVNDSGLTTQQFGVIIGGGLGAALCMIAGTVLLIRRIRQRRFGAESPESRFEKAELDGQSKGASSEYQKPELHEQVRQFVEMSSQTGPVELVGKHLHHELVGGYDTHGASELHGAVPFTIGLSTYPRKSLGIEESVCRIVHVVSKQSQNTIYCHPRNPGNVHEDETCLAMPGMPASND